MNSPSCRQSDVQTGQSESANVQTRCPNDNKDATSHRIVLLFNLLIGRSTLLLDS